MHVISAQKCCGGLFNLPRSVQVGHLKPWCHRHSPLHELPFLPAGIYWFHMISYSFCSTLTANVFLGNLSIFTWVCDGKCCTAAVWCWHWPPKLDGVRFLRFVAIRRLINNSAMPRSLYLLLFNLQTFPKYASSWWFLVGSPLCVV